MIFGDQSFEGCNTFPPRFALPGDLFMNWDPNHLGYLGIGGKEITVVVCPADIMSTGPTGLGVPSGTVTEVSRRCHGCKRAKNCALRQAVMRKEEVVREVANGLSPKKRRCLLRRSDEDIEYIYIYIWMAVSLKSQKMIQALVSIHTHTLGRKPKCIPVAQRRF